MILFPEEASTCTSHNSSDLPTRVHRGGGGEEISKNGSMEPGTHTTEIRKRALPLVPLLDAALDKKVDVWDQGEITSQLVPPPPGEGGREDKTAALISFLHGPLSFFPTSSFSPESAPLSGSFIWIERERKRRVSEWSNLDVAQGRNHPFPEDRVVSFW